MAPTPHLCVNNYLCIRVPTYVPFVMDGPVGSLEKDLSSPQTASHPHQPSWHLAGCASFSAAPLYFPPQRRVQLLLFLETWNICLNRKIQVKIIARNNTKKWMSILRKMHHKLSSLGLHNAAMVSDLNPSWSGLFFGSTFLARYWGHHLPRDTN